MHIERLQVETEGFLAGLDLTFKPGLNVLIGARGTGKTSVVELIRYCLQAGSFTAKAEEAGNQQAIAILEGGAATITIADGESRFLVTRAASGHVTTTRPGSSMDCTVLGQNEIETVGAQASGRLHLVDRYRPSRTESARELDSIRLSLESYAQELASLLNSYRTVAEQVSDLSSTRTQLAVARQEQSNLLGSSSITSAYATQLSELQAKAQQLSARTSATEANLTLLATFETQMEQLQVFSGNLLYTWPTEAGDDFSTQERDRVSRIQMHLAHAAAELQELTRSIQETRDSANLERAETEVHNRHLRQELDSLQAGIGSAARKVAELEEKQGQLQALESQMAEIGGRYNSLRNQRNDLYARLTKIRDEATRERQEVTHRLNSVLGPAIRVRLTSSANVDDYITQIISTLRGSGVHYNNLAPLIAHNVTPLELVTWAEENRVDDFSASTGASADRATAVLAAFRNQGTELIASSKIEDSVDLDLLDGTEYKSTDRLSIGQRCTAVLPLLLGHHGDTLVLDQPEDHLDNAFIVSTLVRALKERTLTDQFIFTSHNANIPVLGEADHIIALGSDGLHGYVRHQGELERQESIDSVTNLMEGGAEAFSKRASFYNQETPRSAG